MRYGVTDEAVVVAVGRSKEPINPFYVAAAALGVLFTLTACAYGLLMVRANRAATMLEAGEQHPLMNLLDRHGMVILGVEVGLLAVLAVAAIALDHYRGKQSNRQDAKLAKEKELRGTKFD